MSDKLNSFIVYISFICIFLWFVLWMSFFLTKSVANYEQQLNGTYNRCAGNFEKGKQINLSDNCFLSYIQNIQKFQWKSEVDMGVINNFYQEYFRPTIISGTTEVKYYYKPINIAQYYCDNLKKKTEFCLAMKYADKISKKEYQYKKDSIENIDKIELSE